MSEEMKKKEDAIFAQTINEEELENVVGGNKRKKDPSTPDNCSNEWQRDIYGGDGFPNCGATVEDGSWCDSNDACNDLAVVYYNIDLCYVSDCHKAWR